MGLNLCAHFLKNLLQLSIDTGEIANMERLFERVREHGLEITRNGHNYIGLRDESGKRFRVRFGFENYTRSSRADVAGTSESTPNVHKAVLESALRDGQIRDMQQLFEYFAAHGLVVTVIRPRSLGLRGSDGRAFAITVPFEHSIPSTTADATGRQRGALSQVPPDLRAARRQDAVGKRGTWSPHKSHRDVSAFLQRAVEAGEISTIEQLLAQVAERRLDVVRSVGGCITLKAGRKTFRVWHNFAGWSQIAQSPVLPTVNQRIWVYALTAFSCDGARRACYIGKTVDVPRRMREHIKLRHGQQMRASSELFAWARVERAEVRVTVLAVMDIDWFQSPHLEGYWLKLAQEAGYETPGSDRWGRLPKPVQLAGQPCSWPWERVALAALALEDVAERGSAPAALHEFTGSVAEEAETGGAATSARLS
jgi:hypothetical protein